MHTNLVHLIRQPLRLNLELQLLQNSSQSKSHLVMAMDLQNHEKYKFILSIFSVLPTLLCQKILSSKIILTLLYPVSEFLKISVFLNYNTEKKTFTASKICNDWRTNHIKHSKRQIQSQLGHKLRKTNVALPQQFCYCVPSWFVKEPSSTQKKTCLNNSAIAFLPDLCKNHHQHRRNLFVYRG
jgi:hypothetical protein